MPKRLTIAAAIIAVTFLAGVGYPGFERAATQADYAATKVDPALWKIERGAATVWLFGTFHLLPPALEWRTEQVMGAFESADTIWMEVDLLNPEAEQQGAVLIQQLGMNPPGVTLSSLLDDETRALLAQVAPAVGAPVPTLEPMRPWLVALLLSVSQIQALGYDPAAGVELVLDAQGQEAGKSFRYFETVAEQLGFFAGLSTDIQAAWLAQTLREMADLPQQVEALTVAWVTGDTDAIDEYINGSMREQSPEIYEVLIENRNRAWIPDILSILEQGGVHFVAVGAGHLTGDDGLVALLEAKGVTAVHQ
jgi:uncharacterized protein